MRINKIEFENLNSLKGHWTIDFSHPDYKKNHDLFVICGETGAGKTTLLDAITLALYGCTPRENISKDMNEVMTRHTGKCMARVTYECKKGTFTSEFSQKKAREQSSGSLQKPNCQIKNEITGEVYPNLAISTLASKTAEIIQLDYDQFCRSIMLAQGDFDKFIMSEPKERAGILAKLNGTEKFKLIGIRVCQNATEANRIYELEKTRKEAIDLLSEEQIEAYEKEVKEDGNKLSTLKKDIELLTENLNWLTQIESLSQAEEDAQRQREFYEQTEKDFAEKQDIFEKAENARNCIAEFTKVNELRKKIDEENKKISDTNVFLEEATNCFSELSDSYTKAESAYSKKNDLREGLEKLWKDVLKIDTEIETKNKEVSRLKNDSDTKNALFETKVKLIEKLDDEIQILGKEMNELNAYLSENKSNEDLPSKIPLLESAQKQFTENLNKISENATAVTDVGAKLTEVEEKLKKAVKEKEDLSSQLQMLVSAEFLSISKLIRNQLKDGTPCPVCGSVSHPSCNDKLPENDSVEIKLGTDVAALHKKLEEAENSVFELEKDHTNLSSLKGSLLKNNEEIAEKNRNLITEINVILSSWNFVLNVEDISENTVDQLKNIISDLKVKADCFITKTALQRAKSQLLENKTTEKNAIELDVLKKESDAARELYNSAKSDIAKLSLERKNLFGDKDLEVEQNNYKEELNILETNKNTADAAKQNGEKRLMTLSGQLESLKKELLDSSVALEKSEQEFREVIKKNGFDSDEEFVRCNISDAEYDSLKNQSNNLKTENTRTKANLEEAQKQLKKCQKENKTEKSKADLLQEKGEKEKYYDEISNTKGGIERALADNQKKFEESKEVRIAYEKALTEKNLWNELKSFIGKNDGSDFENFVQALAFNKLIGKANKFVFAISGRYELVQIPGKVDFLIHDINFPDAKEDRHITNMSGGEKFIISLSLALGIAELASENVKVDSLFLDEGFGTLSGNPLTEAINALKQLQNSGKMLGIITHVDAVINEFDQKITAVKKNGGISVLEGSGINHK